MSILNPEPGEFSSRIRKKETVEEELKRKLLPGVIIRNLPPIPTEVPIPNTFKADCAVMHAQLRNCNCPFCGEPVDKYGNSPGLFIYCCWPDCGCNQPTIPTLCPHPQGLKIKD